MQFLNRLVCGVDAERLVIGELGRRHADLLVRREERHHGPALFGQGNFFVGGKHPVEHAAHLVGQFDVQCFQVAIDVHHPGAEPLEQALQFDAWGLPLEQVRLETAGELLVIAALFLKVEIVPLVQVGDAEPIQHCLGIAQILLLAFLEGIYPVNRGFFLKLGGDVELHLKEEVTGFM